jgi:magnesium transporter
VARIPAGRSQSGARADYESGPRSGGTLRAALSALSKNRRLFAPPSSESVTGPSGFGPQRSARRARELELAGIALGRRGLGVRSLAAKIKDDTIPWSYVQQLPEDIGAFRGNVKLNVLKDKLPEIHPVDLADILEELDHDERIALFSQLDTEHASDTLEEVEPRVQRDLVSSLTKMRAAELINDMTPAQAADFMAVLPASEADAILELIEPDEARKVRNLLGHHEDTIANLATKHFISFRAEVEIREVLDQYRSLARSADVVVYLYVVGEDNKLLGVMGIKGLLLADPSDASPTG